jgi:hypothetical protein
MFSIPYRMVGRASEAEDVVPGGFLRFHRQSGEGTAIESPRPTSRRSRPGSASTTYAGTRSPGEGGSRVSHLLSNISPSLPQRMRVFPGPGRGLLSEPASA